MDALAIFNSIEAVFWITVGLVVWWKSRLSIRHHPIGLIAAVWFILFGISDIFEVFTGAWYRPFSLLVFKAACLIALATCGVTCRLMNVER